MENQTMRKSIAAFCTRSVFFFALVTLLIVSTKSFAQSDTDEIKAVVDNYHAAVGAHDMSKMEPLWTHDDYAMLINPRDQNVSVGWDAVRKGWEGQFGFAATQLSGLKVTQADGPHIHVKGDVAWATGIAGVIGKMKNGVAIDEPTFETDVFEKRDNHWLLVSHTAMALWRKSQ
jgi:ketosteroid isomerase-like protein